LVSDVIRTSEPTSFCEEVGAVGEELQVPEAVEVSDVKVLRDLHHGQRPPETLDLELVELPPFERQDHFALQSTWCNPYRRL